jgi:hypothetical protein
MRRTKFFIILALSLLTTQCRTSSNRISIEIRHFAGAMGLTIYYLVTDKFVPVDTDCDFQDCKRKTVYKQDLTSEQSDGLFNSLQSLRPDTLKKSYTPEEIIFDRLVSSIKLRGSGLPNKEISIDNVDLPATDSLYRIIDRLILIKKYQFYHFGQE